MQKNGKKKLLITVLCALMFLTALPLSAGADSACVQEERSEQVSEAEVSEAEVVEAEASEGKASEGEASEEEVIRTEEPEAESYETEQKTNADSVNENEQTAAFENEQGEENEECLGKPSEEEACALLSAEEKKKILLAVADGAEVKVISENGYGYSPIFGNGIDRWIYIDGAEAYCVNPELHQPASGTYTTAVYTSQIENSLLLNILYYGFEGPGDITGSFVSSNEDRHTLTHIAAAKAYGGNWTYCVNTSGINLVNSFIEAVQQKPQVKGRVLVFDLQNNTQKTVSIFTAKFPSGRAQLIKASLNPKITEKSGCYSLEGAIYGIYTDPDCTISAGSFTTAADGSSEAVTLSPGTYYCREEKAPSGFAVDTEVHTVKVIEDETAYLRVTDVPLNDPAGIELEKLSAEGGPSYEEAQPLSGAQFTVTHYAGYFETEEEADEAAESGDIEKRSWIIETKENDGRYITGLSDEYKVSGDDFYLNPNNLPTLPLGTLVIKETKAPEGYLIDGIFSLGDGSVFPADEAYIAQIRSKNDAAFLEGGNRYSVTDEMIRGDLTFAKTDTDGRSMAGVLFSITSSETGESHLIWTDENGVADTSSAAHPHTVNTNEGKDKNSGIWFGSGAPDDNRGALLYGTYIITELPCENNKGFRLADPVEITVSENGTTVHIGNIVNDRISIRTCLIDDNTASHQSTFGRTRFTDTVFYTNLTPGKEYTVKGTLMDKETEKPLETDGHEITAEAVFTPDKPEGFVSLEYELDASLLSGKTLVAFEELYGDEGLIASHADLEDDEQTVFISELSTTAGIDGAKEVQAGSTARLTDKVSFKGLIPGTEYVLKTRLVNKATGKQEGTEAEKVFTAEKADGTVETVLMMDTGSLSGCEIVVFEELYMGDILVGEHKDITDMNQTVKITPPSETPSTGDPAKLTGTLLMLLAAGCILCMAAAKKHAGKF